MPWAAVVAAVGQIVGEAHVFAQRVFRDEALISESLWSGGALSFPFLAGPFLGRFPFAFGLLAVPLTRVPVPIRGGWSGQGLQEVAHFGLVGAFPEGRLKASACLARQGASSGRALGGDKLEELPIGVAKLIPGALSVARRGV